MSDLRKAAEMALEALEELRFANAPFLDKAMEALRQALSQPEQECIYPECETGVGCDGPCGSAVKQEPVAWINNDQEVFFDEGKARCYSMGWIKPLYAQPVDTVNISQERETAKGEHEPVAVGALSVRYFRGDKAMTDTDFEYFGDLPEGDYTLYTAPPKQPKQEPVKYKEDEVVDGVAIKSVYTAPPHYWGNVTSEELVEELRRGGMLMVPVKEQEPVAHLWECIGRWTAMIAHDGEYANLTPPDWLVDAVKAATAPPKREWVGLTGLEQKELMVMNSLYALFATEAKLKEKNT